MHAFKTSIEYKSKYKEIKVKNKQTKKNTHLGSSNICIESSILRKKGKKSYQNF